MLEVDSYFVDFDAGFVLSIEVRSSSIALIVIGRLIISIPTLLILWLKLDHIYPSLVGWLRWRFCLWRKGLGVWQRLRLGDIGGFPSIQGNWNIHPN